MTLITPCLWFDSEAEEAAEFYAGIFPNSRVLEVSRYTEAGPGPAGGAMVVSFELDGTRFVALNGGPEFTFTEAISFQIDCRSQEEVDFFWERLTDGGSESRCGWLKDRFGLSWQVVPTRLVELLRESDAETAARVTRAMLGMSKIDIAALEEAAASEVGAGQ